MAREIENSLVAALDVVRGLTYSEIYSRMTESDVVEVGEDGEDRRPIGSQSNPQDGDTPPLETYHHDG